MLDEINRNQWTESIGISGRIESESLDGYFRNQWTDYPGIHMRQGHTLHLLRGINNIGPALLESSFTLHPNFPNPFNPATVIPIDLPASGRCTIQVLDLLGTEVAVLHDGFLEAGSHRFTFDGRDLPSGVYTCRSSFNGVTRSHCMVLLR